MPQPHHPSRPPPSRVPGSRPRPTAGRLDPLADAPAPDPNALRLQWALRLVVVLALPTVACFGFYAVDGLDDGHRGWALPLALAYPVLLLSAVGWVRAMASAQPAPRARIAWAVLTLLAGTVVLLARR